MILFEEVTKRFPGGQEALAGLSLTIDKGEMAFVTGHSGAGKSTPGAAAPYPGLPAPDRDGVPGSQAAL